MAQQKKNNTKNKSTGSKSASNNTKKQTASKTTAKKSTAKSTTKPDTKQKQQPQNKPEPTQEELMLHGEMASIAMMGLSLIVLICVLASDRMGFIGGYISAGIKHTFGIGGLAIPIVFLAFGFQLFRHKCSGSEFKRRTILFSGFLLAFISIAHVLTYKNAATLTFASYVAECFNNGSLTNGGLIGALIGGGLSKVIGTVGAYILLVVALVILFIKATGKSISAFFSMIGDTIDGIKRDDEYDNDYADDYEEMPPKAEQKTEQMQAPAEDETKSEEADTYEDTSDSSSNGIKIDIKQKSQASSQPQPKKKGFSIFNLFSREEEESEPQPFVPRFPVDIPMGETKSSADEEITIENFIVNENHKFIKRTLRVPDYVPHLSDKIEKAKADIKSGTQASDITIDDSTGYDPEILFRDIEGADDEYNLNDITINGVKQRFDEFKDSLSEDSRNKYDATDDNSPVDITLNSSFAPSANELNNSVAVEDEPIAVEDDNTLSTKSNMSIHILEERSVDESNPYDTDTAVIAENDGRNLTEKAPTATDFSDKSAEQNDEEARAILEALNSLENMPPSTNQSNVRNSAVNSAAQAQQSSPVRQSAVQEPIQPKAYTEPYSADNAPLIIEAEEERNVKTLATEKVKTEYKFPKLEFLSKSEHGSGIDKREMYEKAKKLENTLSIFGIDAKVNNISQGPAVTRYELTPPEGVKVSKIESLENDIMLALAANSIRMEVPIPGKSAIGIEIPNDSVHSVFFSEILMSEKFNNFKSKLAFGLGKDITGNVIVTDIAKMPHLLIAGATGSGKSVCVNTMLTSILYKSTPDEVKLILIDPKVVELSVYNGIPHLLIPVVTDPHKAAGALNWAVREMMRRYDLFASTGTRKLEGYNEKVSKEERLPQILVVIDELADLMIAAKKEVENSIQRLTQLARAAGIHLIIATQRPSVDVITGVIKANVPSRIAFKVSSTTDSRTILDVGGAEKLLGKGDMLFKAVDMDKALRIQGAFVSDDEVERIVDYIKVDESNYDKNIMQELERAAENDDNSTSGSSGSSEGDEGLMNDVISFVVHSKKASISSIQRKFRIGYNRAANIMDELEERGIVGADLGGTKGREVLMDKHELNEWMERRNNY